MKNNKILFLLHIPPPVHGSSMVGKWIMESIVINENISSRYLNLLASKSVDQTGKISLEKLFGMIGLVIKLIIELLFHRPNKVYFALTTTGGAFYRDCLLVFILKLFRLKIIYHLHNKGVKKASEKTLNSWLYQLVFRNTEVILLSKFLYQDIENYVSKDHIRICNNGIPEIVIYENKKDKSSEKVNILFLSNLIESKGVYVLLESLKILKSKGLQFNANFVGGEGDISKENFEKKINEFNLNECVKYLGKKYDEEKTQVFANADLFVLPTFYKNECFPLVLLEALQYSLPVITCPEGGIPEIIEDGKNGILVPQENIKELSRAIELLILDSNLRKQMGNEGQLKYKDKFTLSQFEKNMASILKI